MGNSTILTHCAPCYRCISISLVGFNRRFAPIVVRMRSLLAPIAEPKLYHHAQCRSSAERPLDAGSRSGERAYSRRRLPLHRTDAISCWYADSLVRGRRFAPCRAPLRTTSKSSRCASKTARSARSAVLPMAPLVSKGVDRGVLRPAHFDAGQLSKTVRFRLDRTAISARLAAGQRTDSLRRRIRANDQVRCSIAHSAFRNHQS